MAQPAPNRPSPPPHASVDGIARSPDAEDRLNQLAASVFRGANGHEFMTYLRLITANTVLGPEASDHALRHREGMRYLFAIIETRIQLGHHSLGKQAQTSEEKQ